MAIGGDIVVGAPRQGVIPSFEEHSGLAGAKGALVCHIGDQHLVAVAVEQFTSAARPDRLHAAFCRHLELAPSGIRLDVDLRAEKLTGSNLVVVGGPRTNVVAGELNPHLPIRFRQGGFWGSIVDENGRSYGSEVDCVVAKVRNPWNPERVCIIAAGLTGAGTKAAIIGICNFADVLFQKYRSGDYAALLKGTDKDGDGKVDSVDILKQL